jgi:hypothetical protein
MTLSSVSFAVKAGSAAIAAPGSGSHFAIAEAGEGVDDPRRTRLRRQRAGHGRRGPHGSR